MAEERGGLAGLASRLLDYLDRPWKAFAIAGLLVVGGVGWALYEQRGEIIESWLTPSEVSLKVDEVPAALIKLTEETSADLVQIWSVDLSANSQRFLGARRHDGDRPVIPEPRRLPIIVHVSDLTAIVNVLSGSPVCVDMNEHGTPFARRLAERGFTRGCAIPIPPGPSSFVGVVYLAWITGAGDSQETVAVGAAREIASKLVNR